MDTVDGAEHNVDVHHSVGGLLPTSASAHGIELCGGHSGRHAT